MLELPEISELKTESDVEQKLLFPLLSTELPYGLGIPSSYILTKHSTRRLKIGKGTEEKLYFPDYIVMCEGLPVAIIEAKAPNESVETGFREARLYANEINSKFPPGFNPVKFIIAGNGPELFYGTADNDFPIKMSYSQISVATEAFANLQELISGPTLVAHAKTINLKQKPPRYWKPKKMLGGNSVQSEEIGSNTFGLTLSAEFGHVFAPETLEDRSEIARNAYVDSRASLRAIDPIDKIIRAARPVSETNATEINDTSNPTEVFQKLRSGSKLEHKILLLIGSVGSGKSTFVDHLIYKALPPDLIKSTLWCRIDMNTAPVSNNEIYRWLRGKISEGCMAAYPDEDFDSLDVITRVFSVEHNRFQKTYGRLLKDSGDLVEYNRSLLRAIDEWQSNDEIKSKAITRFCCGDRGKLLIIVLDNCDKRSRDEQLLMFQAAQWIQNEYRSLVILPLREETYEVHRDEPPLDTALKDLIFRIQAPLFQHVLIKRVQLALSQMKGDGRRLQYDLPNGFRVEYPATDQAYYLASIIKSLFQHDRFIRRMITGLSGRNIRRALEIFIDFCNSAHLGEDEIFKIRKSEGKHTLPLHLVTRILLRGNLRYYAGQNSFVKNLFEIFHKDESPFYFARLFILRWLSQRFTQPGRNGVRGYFPVSEIRSDLISVGVPDYVFDRELDSLIKAHCILSENLTVTKVAENDLIRIGSAGHVHLELLGSVDYLATIAEDTWLDNEASARTIADRIGRLEKHFHTHTQIDNARDIVNYLNKKHEQLIASLEAFRELDAEKSALVDFSQPYTGIENFIKRSSETDEWFDLDKRLPAGRTVTGKIMNRTSDHGLFVEVAPGITGLLHKSRLPVNYMKSPDLVQNESLDVLINYVDTMTHKISLSLAEPSLF